MNFKKLVSASLLLLFFVFSQAQDKLVGVWKAEYFNLNCLTRKITDQDRLNAVFRDLFDYKGALEITPETLQYAGGAGLKVPYTVKGNSIFISTENEKIVFTYAFERGKLKLTYTSQNGIIQTYYFTK